MAQRFETRTVHVSTLRTLSEASKTTPIYQTSAFSFSSLEEVEAVYRGERRYIYTRSGNPNQEELATAVAALEGAESGVSAASGMAAIMAGLLAVLGPGDRVLAYRELYGGTYGLLRRELSRFGIALELIDLSPDQGLKPFLTPTTRMLLLETITNPLLSVVDLPYWLGQAKQHGLYTLVDNTFATPYLAQPVRHGADLVVHSATKYIGGHGDVVAGLAVGPASVMNQIRKTTLKDFGGILSPFDAWLLLRGLKTLAVRMERHSENALRVARYLEEHPLVMRVYYPGLESSPQYELARRQMDGFGGLLSFELIGGIAAGRTLLGAVHLCTVAVSLGDTDTLIQHPASMTHAVVPPEARAAAGISDGLVRLSVGLEDADDIIADLNQALAAVGRSTRNG